MKFEHGARLHPLPSDSESGVKFSATETLGTFSLLELDTSTYISYSDAINVNETLTSSS